MDARRDDAERTGARDAVAGPDGARPPAGGGDPSREIRDLQDAIFRSKVARARRTPMSEKLADGPRLFDESLQIMRGAIRTEHPEYSPEQVEQEVRRRVRIARRIDDAGTYRDVERIEE